MTVHQYQLYQYAKVKAIYTQYFIGGDKAMTDFSRLINAVLDNTYLRFEDGGNDMDRDYCSACNASEFHHHNHNFGKPVTNNHTLDSMGHEADCPYVMAKKYKREIEL